MSASSASGQDIFDVRKIRRLVELMKEHDLAEIDLQQGEVRVQLRRATALSSAAVVPPPSVPPPYGPPVPAPEAPAAPEPDSASGTIIKSPMVGTFYTSADPDSPAFVKVGDHVGPETTICIVEAMKVFNQIPAETTGRIIAMLVENGAPVEFGQPLFKVDTRE